MNPFTQEMIGAIVRTLVAALAGAGVLSESELQQYSGAFGVLLIGAWSVYQKYVARQKLVTAAASTVKMSEAEIAEKIAAGQAASVTTPVAKVPVIVSASR